MTPRPSDIASLRATLKGQDLHIPDLRPLFMHWPNFLSSQTLPSVEVYWEGRLGSSAVSSYAALAKFMIGITIPDFLRDDENIKTMWFELNRNVSYVNDMVSLKKELNVSVYSLIPVTIKETGNDLPRIVAGFIEGLRISIENFDQAAACLLDRAGEETEEIRAGVERYVHVFRTMMTGSLCWSLASDRYGDTEFIQRDGSLVIPL
ncbi:hypothetical protein OQA88_6237 [Cercophora sp. LCS_1]